MSLRWSRLAWAISSSRLGSCCTRHFGFSPADFKGHSKWQNIKSTKAAADARRSKTTNRLVSKVYLVARDGLDVRLNKNLAALHQEFRSLNLSLDAFNRAIERIKTRKLVTHYFGLVGPEGSLFVIHTETENRLKMQQLISRYINKVGGGFRFASVEDQFVKKGIIRVNGMNGDEIIQLETMEELGIELECEDVSLVDQNGEKCYEFLCPVETMHGIQKKLHEKKYDVLSTDQEMRALYCIAIQEEVCVKVEKLYQFLDDNEDVIQIFDNIDPQASV